MPWKGQLSILMAAHLKYLERNKSLSILAPNLVKAWAHDLSQGTSSSAHSGLVSLLPCLQTSTSQIHLSMQPTTTRAAAAVALGCCPQGHVAPTGGSVPLSSYLPSGLAFRMSAVPAAGSSVPREKREGSLVPILQMLSSAKSESELRSSLLLGFVAFDLQAKVFSELMFNKKPCRAHRISKSPGNGAAMFSAEEQRN